MALGRGVLLLTRLSPCVHRVTGLGPLDETQSAAAGGAAARVDARAADAAASITVEYVCLIRIAESFPRSRYNRRLQLFCKKSRGTVCLACFLPPTVTGYGHLITR